MRIIDGFPFYSSMDEVKATNKAKGQHWFSRDTMRFFQSRIASDVLAGNLFVTSERYDDNTPRLYTVREVDADGDVSTVGKFQAYNTARQARTAAYAYANRRDSVRTLHTLVSEGETVYSIVTRRTNNGLARWVRFFVTDETGLTEITGHVAFILDLPRDKADGAAKFAGVGMDYAAHAVRTVSGAMFDGDAGRLAHGSL